MKKVFLFLMMVAVSVNLLNAQWSSNPQEPLGISDNGKYNQDLVHSAICSDGKVYVSWLEKGDDSSFTLHLQLLDNAGNKLWADGGIVISDYSTLSWVTDYALAATPDGDAVLLFFDVRHDPGNPSAGMRPYAYRVNQKGESVWAKEGVELPFEGFCGAGRLAVVGDDIYAFYQEINSNPTYVMVSKMTADGSLAWENPLRFDGSDLSLVPTDNNELIAVWKYMQGCIVAQRFNAEGKIVWTDRKEVEPRAIDSHGPLSVVSDGKGGFVVAYRRFDENSSTRGIACVQHMSADGSLLMGSTAVDLPGMGNHGSPITNVNADNECLMVFWCVTEGGGADKVIYQKVQTLDFAGKSLWGEDGIVLREDANGGRLGFSQYRVIPQENGEWIVVGNIGRENYRFQLFGQRLDTDGKTVYENKIGKETRVSRVNVLEDGCQLFVLWLDDTETYSTGVVGQNMWFDGTFGVDSGSVEGLDADNGEMWYDVLTSQLRFSEPIDGVVEVFNLQGMKVATQCAESVEALSLSLSSGVYIVRVQSVDKVFSDKVIVR